MKELYKERKISKKEERKKKKNQPKPRPQPASRVGRRSGCVSLMEIGAGRPQTSYKGRGRGGDRRRRRSPSTSNIHAILDTPGRHPMPSFIPSHTAHSTSTRSVNTDTNTTTQVWPVSACAAWWCSGVPPAEPFQSLGSNTNKPLLCAVPGGYEEREKREKYVIFNQGKTSLRVKTHLPRAPLDESDSSGSTRQHWQKNNQQWWREGVLKGAFTLGTRGPGSESTLDPQSSVCLFVWMVWTTWTAPDSKTWKRRSWIWFMCTRVRLIDHQVWKQVYQKHSAGLPRLPHGRSLKSRTVDEKASRTQGMVQINHT